MVTIDKLTNYFLIATPSLNDSFFQKTVTYICEHTEEEGAMGLIVNSPITISMDIVYKKLASEDMPAQFKNLAFRPGGPLKYETHFVIHRNDGRTWDKTFHLTDELSLTSSTDILKHFIEDPEDPPKDALITLGFAGWEPGQLEAEICSDDWLICPADPRIIFDTPLEERWNAALALQGIDPKRFFHTAGHC